jgi:hypothetical protein
VKRSEVSVKERIIYTREKTNLIYVLMYPRILRNMSDLLHSLFRMGSIELRDTPTDRTGLKSLAVT